jgi:hypothetical protein
VPADHGFWRDEDEGLLLRRPDPPTYPEELNGEAKARARARMLTLKDNWFLT